MDEFRLPPQNLEAEESLLSALLQGHQVDQALDILKPEDFYRSGHKKIFESIQSLNNKKDPVDIVTVTTHLKEADQLESIGGAVYIANLIEEIPMSTSVEYYAKLIKEKSVARQFIEISYRHAKSLYDSSNDLHTIIDSAQTEILNIGMDIRKQEFLHMRDLTMESIERYEGLRDRTRKLGIKTGFDAIDGLTGGFFGSKLIIIAARPKIGKTALALNMTRNMAKKGHQVGFFELEMDKEEIDDRWMAMETGINTMCLSTGTGPNNKQWAVIQEAAGEKYGWPIIVDDTGGQTIGELKRRIRKMVKMGCEIIFVDQLSKIRKSNPRQVSWEANTDHVVELKQTAKELKTPIVLLVQLNREVEKRSPPIPTTADFKLTGAIEEEADIAFLGYRRFPYTEKPEDKNHAWWHLALHRGGPTRRVMMHWEPKTTVFTEIKE